MTSSHALVEATLSEKRSCPPNSITVTAPLALWRYWVQSASTPTLDTWIHSSLSIWEASWSLLTQDPIYCTSCSYEPRYSHGRNHPSSGLKSNSSNTHPKPNFHDHRNQLSLFVQWRVPASKSGALVVALHSHHLPPRLSCSLLMLERNRCVIQGPVSVALHFGAIAKG